MAEKRNQSGLIRATSRVTSGAIAIAQAPQTLRERLNKLLLPVAWLVGAAGTSLLVVCFLLRYIPEENWPRQLDPAHWTRYALLCLVCSSLVGWGCMQQGLGRLRRMIGWKPGGVILVLVPILCVGVSQLLARELLVADDWPERERVVMLLRWYPPGVVGVSLVVFLLGELGKGFDDEGRRRGLAPLWALALVLPYAFLMASLFGLTGEDTVSLPIADTLHEAGTWAIVLQVTMAWFFSPASAA